MREEQFIFQRDKKFKEARKKGHEPEGCGSVDCFLCGPIFGPYLLNKGERKSVENERQENESLLWSY